MPKRLIGPRRKSGAFYKKRPNYKTGGKKVTKSVKKYVKRAIKGAEETKYASSQLCNNYSIDYPIHTPYNPTNGGGDILPLTLPIAQGTSENLRDGRKITPVKSYVDLQLSFVQSAQGAEPAPNTLLSNELYVVMYLVRSKNIKNWTMFANQTASAPWNNLLDLGNNTAGQFGYSTVDGNSPPNTILYTDASLLGMPVEKEHYTLIKKKVVKFVRNVGAMTNDGTNGNAPNLSNSCYRGRLYYRLPKLIYDDTVQNTQYYGGYPTNSNVMLMLGCVLANNQPSYTTIAGIKYALPNPISLTARVHCWYKDA